MTIYLSHSIARINDRSIRGAWHAIVHTHTRTHTHTCNTCTAIADIDRRIKHRHSGNMLHDSYHVVTHVT